MALSDTPDPPPDTEARLAIKRAALLLCAGRGIDGVTVRDIARTAGQKNHGAVGYHFGSKEALVRELVVDGARIIDRRRIALLDTLEAQGGPTSIVAVTDAIVFPALDPFDAGEADCYQRFIVILRMTHAELFRNAIGNRWNQGYQRCLAHLRRMMPDMPPSIKNQRLVFMGSYLAMLLALRQTSLSDTSREHATWASNETLRHISYTAAAMVEAPHDAAALKAPPPQQTVTGATATAALGGRQPA